MCKKIMYHISYQCGYLSIWIEFVSYFLLIQTMSLSYALYDVFFCSSCHVVERSYWKQNWSKEIENNSSNSNEFENKSSNSNEFENKIENKILTKLKKKSNEIRQMKLKTKLKTTLKTKLKMTLKTKFKRIWKWNWKCHWEQNSNKIEKISIEKFQIKFVPHVMINKCAN
jgi:hypothetical protein